MSIFGFSTEPTTGDFLPILKYDARAGRIFRVDRTVDGRVPIDITDNFAAVFDFENVETGWMNFSGTIPDFKLVKMGETLPVRPSENHKNGIRVMIKLHPNCAGADKPVREFSTSAKAALQGLEKLFLDYQQSKPANGKLPIVAMRGSSPIKSGSGDKQSTNYVPRFEIVGWANRPSDLIYIPRGSSGPNQDSLKLTIPHSSTQAGNGQVPWQGGDWGSTPPNTGSTRMQAPLQQVFEQAAQQVKGWPGETPAVGQPKTVPSADDFG